MDDFLTKMKGYLDRGVEVSKDALVKAGGKVQDFGGKSVTRIEITQLESKIQKATMKLGEIVLAELSSSVDVVITKDTAGVGAILNDIANAQTEIEQKKILLSSESENS